MQQLAHHSTEHSLVTGYVIAGVIITILAITAIVAWRTRHES